MQMAKYNVPPYGNRSQRRAAAQGAGGMDMGAIMQQAKKMQEELANAQEKAKLLEASASAGGGMVKATVSGDLQLKELTIDPEAVDPEDVELLQDMIIACVNDALNAASDAANQEVSSATGLGGPGGLGGDDPFSALGLSGLF